MSAQTCRHYIVAVDPGLSMQHTAIAIIEQHTRREPRGRSECTAIQLRHLERLPLDATYPQTVERTKERLGALEVPEDARQSDLIVDVTGTGRAIAGLMKTAGMDPITVAITAGMDENEITPRDWRLPKIELVGNLQVLFQTEKLKTAKALPLVPVLLQELQDFKLKPSPVNLTDTESWREGQHDDLVFAVGLAAWRAVRETPSRAGRWRTSWEKNLYAPPKRRTFMGS